MTEKTKQSYGSSRKPKTETQKQIEIKRYEKEIIKRKLYEIIRVKFNNNYYYEMNKKIGLFFFLCLKRYEKTPFRSYEKTIII